MDKIDMIKNYLRIAFRNIKRHKGFASINIIGLAIGIGACLLLFLVVNYELSYDKFHKNYDRVYHVVTQDNRSGESEPDFTSGIPYPALDALRTDFPGVQFSGVCSSNGSQFTITGSDSTTNATNKKFIEGSGVYFADPQFFDLFSAEWLSGSPQVLKEPHTVVLSKTIAEKYFTDYKEAVGKFIKMDNAITLKVAGIVADPPFNTDFPLSIIASYETFKRAAPLTAYSPEWGSTSSSHNVYMLMPPNVKLSSINSQLVAFSNKHYNNNNRNKRLNFARPLSEVHFDTRFSNYGDHITNKTTLTTLTFIGILIIIMACINFINLSTAQAISRSREVGVRKVLGGTRWQLLWQMMGETALIVLFSIILAIGLAYFAVPYLRHFVSLQENINMFTSPAVIFLVVTGIIVTILSGFYPALIMSGFKPALALKNKITSASVGKISLRRALVVLQFGISQVLIIGTIVAVSQMDFIKNADLGFNKEAIMVVSANSDSVIVSRQPAFKYDLMKVGSIKSVSFSSDMPSSDNNWGTNFAFDGKDDENYTLFLKYGDADYFKTYDLKMVAGRSYEHSDTAKEYVINETLARKLGYTNVNEAVGKNLRMGRRPWKPVVGVVKDFKTNSLREEVKPLAISANKTFYSTTAIKIRSSNPKAIQEEVQKIWDKHYPEYVNNISFMDESINRFYQQEEQLSLLYKVFAGLALLISCLGLYGLVSFMAVQKTKEVGIRKVLGASVGSIVYLFSKEFTILIGVAFLIAAPVAYYMMNNWLNDFVEKVPIGAGIFLLAIAVSIIVAWITVGYKAVKAAVVNPVKSLKSE